MKTLIGLGVLLALSAAGCERSAEGPIRIGSKNFSEQVILGEIAAQGLEQRGLAVDRRLNLGGTFVCHQAMIAGELDLYPEYTGTAFTAILKRKPVSDPSAVRQEIAREYRKRWNVVWAPPLGFENTFALVMRGDDARRLGIRKISDVAPHAATIRPGFGYEFLEREDGFPGLAKTYGLTFGERPVQMDLGLLYPALESRKVDLVAGNSTDGLIDAVGGVVLEDDRRYFPPYEAAFVLRGEAWNRPAVRSFFESLAGRLDAATMRKLNAAADKEKRRPEDIAKEFLAKLGSGR